MPRLYLLRHGMPAGGGADPPLSPEGERLLAAQAAGLARLQVAFDVIVASPLRRAARTAEIIAEGTGYAGTIAIAEAVANGLSVRALIDLLEPHRLTAARFDHVLIVGHAPDIGRVAGDLTDGHGVPMHRGTLCCVETAVWPPSAPGALVFLLPAAVLAAAGSPPG